jgi:hypothetical protein
MANFTRDWIDRSDITDYTIANQIDDYIRYTAVDISDRLKSMIYGFISGENDGNPGIKNLIFKQQESAPSTPNADELVLYALDDGTNCGLYAKNENGYTKQVLKKIGTDLQFGIEAADIPDDTITEAKIQLTNDGYLKALNAAGTGEISLIKANASDAATLPDGSRLDTNAAPTYSYQIANKKYVDDTFGDVYDKIVQVVNYQTGNVAIGTAIIPLDDTIPQIGEGTQGMSLEITPLSATNKLKIDVVINLQENTGGNTALVAALFNGGANALACNYSLNGTTYPDPPICFSYYMTAGTVSPMTFTVRFGGSGVVSITMNGNNGSRRFGGVLYSSITITEISN